MAKPNTATTTADVSKAHQFILDKSKLNEAGDARSLTQSVYLEYMQDEHQLTPETIKAVAHGDRELFSAAAAVATADLVPLIAKAKKEGDDPAELSTSVRISRPGGPVSVEVRSEKTTTNPKTGEKIVHHGVVNVKARMKNQMDPAAAKTAEEIIGKLMG